MAKVLIIGAGAREHILAKTFFKSPQVDQVFVAPGNEGMIEERIKIVPINIDDLKGMVDFAKKENIDLTFVGSEEPLVLGIVDEFKKAGLKIFGPNKTAAQLEGSKSFAKSILKEANVPTAAFSIVRSLSEARRALVKHDFPVVFKLDGLAAGKGVSVISSCKQAEDYIVNLYKNNSNTKLLIEEFMQGPEFSLFSLVGKNNTVVHTPIAQDHKRRFDGDKGPNTGGMGAYSPVAQISFAIIEKVIKSIVEPVLKVMQDKGNPFTGVLYTGLMLTKSGPKVIEFNVRFGDPEAQVVLPQLKGDFYQMIIDLMDGRKPLIEWQKKEIYLAVVIAAPGYPDNVDKGFSVPLLDDLPSDLQIDYAAVKKDGHNLISSGGRVATIVGHAKKIQLAQKDVYSYLDRSNLQLAYRHDIANQLAKFERDNQ
ncbi:phosphoribosylamine--glycine ligase [Oenococcus oeni S25]|uniref:phosphoribosylamine--glycine ligase n=2 Tax=Oenococcus oeni TaxID=1247 RepID=UPI00050E3503|nr:phosphoribosylamine--glycine ligase [Oenococcus oeni]KGO16468.1 phosphoribosylamine--glycine ligase [Oenococcus oeni X2L]KGH56025.1 phosphoribosylamine--glycine ligase [Oenococcus oeni S22]KGH69826.1 phosphoribosylamine--glycine ligase [Oenococcus oeni S25]KGH89373.1 phosphoribosylamine--glycine ligase [Oenococcus oeni IOEB_L26_1]OIK62348.1 phosphoribosylamine--glycine ligase [Oenococcus oeni]